MIEVVHEPEPEHYCGPNRFGMWADHLYDPVGTVLECSECGKSWVAGVAHPLSGFVGRIWRPEGLIAKWRRKRRERKEAAQDD